MAGRVADAVKAGRNRNLAPGAGITEFRWLTVRSSGKTQLMEYAAGRPKVVMLLPSSPALEWVRPSAEPRVEASARASRHRRRGGIHCRCAGHPRPGHRGLSGGRAHVPHSGTPHDRHRPLRPCLRAGAAVRLRPTASDASLAAHHDGAAYSTAASTIPILPVYSPYFWARASTSTPVPASTWLSPSQVVRTTIDGDMAMSTG